MTSTCSNPDCNVSKDGICVEGFKPASKCHQFGSDSSNEDDFVDVGVNSVPENTPLVEPVDVELFGGEALNAGCANELLKQFPTKIIVFSGPSNVGKTTLFASLYEQLQYDTLAGLAFGGSRTLYAFERLCHTARLTSNLPDPTTPHTTRSEGARFYHLALQKMDERKRIDLLFTDRAGEDYDDAVKSSRNCRALYEVKRADTVLFLVDAAQLGDVRCRHAAREKVLNLLKSFQRENFIREASDVAVVLTRCDLLKESARKEMAENDLEIIREKANELFDSARATLFHVAAQPRDNAYGDKGLSELLLFLAEPVKTIEYSATIPLGKRSFHRVRETV